MRLGLSALWAVTAVVAAVPLGWSGSQLRSARAAAAETGARLSELQAQADELRAIRGQLPPKGDEPSPPAELPALVSAVLQKCGLPSSALSRLDAAALADRRNAGVRQRASLVLTQVTLADTGKFLAEWRQAEPHWTVATVELSPRGDPPASGGDLPLQAVIALEAVMPATPKGAVP